MLRPGADLVEEMGGLHGFMNWPGFVLTDSGGYQIFSLEPKIDDEGALFKSTYDGSKHKLTPEGAVDIQTKLGADIQMVLDVCPPLPAPDSVILNAVDQTHRWAERARASFLDRPERADGMRAQFGIVQGGLDLDLRVKSANFLMDIGFEGYGIGGLSVGEKRTQMLSPLRATTDVLPVDQPRYLMGVGDPLSIVEGIANGVDMFDCVLPTRLARHGTVLTTEGRMNLKNATYARQSGPVDPGFANSPLAPWSRAYLRHLLQVKEQVAGRLLTLHNIAFLFDLVDKARSAIENGTIDELVEQVAEVWS